MGGSVGRLVEIILPCLIFVKFIYVKKLDKLIRYNAVWGTQELPFAPTSVTIIDVSNKTLTISL